jgi:NtrC-family two-component system response regulator AlgB
LSGVCLMIPPLRLRKEDILPLANRFIIQASSSHIPPTLTPDVQHALLEYEWRGNVRELENVIFRAAILAGPRRTIETQDLPEHIANIDFEYRESPFASSMHDNEKGLKSLEEVERDYIAHVISKTGSLEEAAKILKIDSATLWRKRKKFAL